MDSKGYDLQHRNFPHILLMGKVFEIQIDENDDITGMDFNSFVGSPAHGKAFQMFGKKPEPLFFADEEKQVVTGVAIAANKLIKRHDESIGVYDVFFSANTIEKIRNKFFEHGFNNKVNLEHNDNEVAKGVFMVDSYLVDKANGIFPLHLNDDDIDDGSWIVSYKVKNKKLWNDIKKGDKYNGLSIQGMFDHKEVINKNKISMNKESKSVRELLFGSKVKSKFATATTENGIEISYEGELQVGTEVFTMDADGNPVPAPEGVHIIGEKSIVLDASGIVTEVIDTPADVPTEDVEAVIEAIVEEMNEMKVEMAAISKENKELKAENDTFKTEFAKFSKTPAVEPKRNFPKVAKSDVPSNNLLNKYLNN